MFPIPVPIQQELSFWEKIIDVGGAPVAVLIVMSFLWIYLSKQKTKETIAQANAASAAVEGIRTEIREMRESATGSYNEVNRSLLKIVESMGAVSALLKYRNSSNRGEVKDG